MSSAGETPVNRYLNRNLAPRLVISLNHELSPKQVLVVLFHSDYDGNCLFVQLGIFVFYLCQRMSKTVRRSQDRQKQSHDAHARAWEFQVDDLVYVRNYGPGPTWLPGKVTGKAREVSYTVLLEDGQCSQTHRSAERPCG